MKAKRIAVVLNPVAGGGKGSKVWMILRPGLEALFQSIECRMSNRTEDVRVATRTLLEAKPDVLLVIGGDGTLNQAVNGFMHKDRPLQKNAQLAYFNAGCGGDFARLFPPQAITDFLSRMANKVTQKSNIGKIAWDNGHYHYFINIASCGLSAYISQRTAQSRWLKKLGGRLNYLGQSVLGLLHYRAKKVRISIDNETAFDTPMLLLAACNGQYFGGKMHVAPSADCADGLLDIVLFSNMGRFEALWKFPKIYWGKHIQDMKVYFRQAKHIRIEPLEEDCVDVEADGEYLMPLPAEIFLLEKPLEVIV